MYGCSFSVNGLVAWLWKWEAEDLSRTRGRRSSIILTGQDWRCYREDLRAVARQAVELVEKPLLLSVVLVRVSSVEIDSWSRLVVIGTDIFEDCDTD